MKRGRSVYLRDLNEETASEVLHDLRSPLLGIAMGADTLIQHEENIAPEKRVRILKNISDCARNQIKFAEELLSRTQGGGAKSSLFFESLKLSGIAADAMRNSLMAAKRKEIGIEIVADANEPFFEGDRQQLVRLFANLIDNGVKFTASGGSIRVKILTKADEIVVCVTNSATVRPSDGTGKVFRRSGDDGLAAAEDSGYGCGLSIVWRVVSLHGGSLSVESEFGEETSVAIRFPRIKG